MEFFNKAKAVRLKCHLGKYLVADEDEETVRLSRKSSSARIARWTIERVEGNAHLLRLKSCFGKYLSALDEQYLMGTMGNKVVQDHSNSISKMEPSILWEPIKEGLSHVKLRTKAGGKFLRANGGTPPWRNTVTHDFPHRTSSQDWVFWNVDILELDPMDTSCSGDYGSVLTSFSSGGLSEYSDDSGSFDGASRKCVSISAKHSRDFSEDGSNKSMLSKHGRYYSEDGSHKSMLSKHSRDISVDGSQKSMMSEHSRDFSEDGSNKSMSSKHSHHNSSEAESEQMLPHNLSHSSTKESGMELFHNAKSVRLRSRHQKYLLAEEDEETVIQDRNGSCKSARWTVEIVEGRHNVLRLKSCFGKYLTATNMTYFMTGKKVLQTLPNRLDATVEWEPIREGFQVRLRTQSGNFLRANGGLPPWRNSVTHDIPHRTATQDWVLWDVDVVEIRPYSPPRITNSEFGASHAKTLTTQSARRPNSTYSEFGTGSPRSKPTVTSQSQSAPKANLADSERGSPQLKPTTSQGTLSKLELSESLTNSMMKRDGRVIYYSVKYNDDDSVHDEAIEGPSIKFKGNIVEELRQRLKEETGIDKFIICSRNPLNGKLFPLKLHLPPNNATMYVVIVPSAS